jgi:hypothetical protein
MPLADDPDHQRFASRLEVFHQMSAAERLKLAIAHVKRGDRCESGLKALQARFPDVCKKMLESACFHAYQELPSQVVDLLAWNELSLREGVHDNHSGIIFNCHYHFYNWQTFESLAPHGKSNVVDELWNVLDCIKQGDEKGAQATVQNLIEWFEANETPPRIDG